MNALGLVVALLVAQAPKPGDTTPPPTLPSAQSPVTTTTLPGISTGPLANLALSGTGVERADAQSPAATDPPKAGPAAPQPDKAAKTPEAPPWPAHGLPTVGGWDIAATAGLIGALTIVQFGVPAPTQGNWAGNAFDDWVRGGLRLSSESGRQVAGTTSDVFVFALTALPFLNATLVAGVEHERWDIAWRLMVLDAETLATATLAAISLQKLTRRERPFVQECQANPNLSDCTPGGRYQSFPSAHTTLVFAAVALECFHHGYLDTSHTGWGAAACPATVTVATLTAVLRVMADRHWATDVLAGALLGGSIGLAIPLLHLAVAKGQTPTVVTPAIGPGMLGLSVAGRF